MSPIRIRSLQVRLAVRLAALYVAATALAVGILIYQAYETAGSLNDRELSLRAADLARYVAVDSNGTARLELPPALAASYRAAGNTDIFAVRRDPDAVLAASPANFGEVAAKWPLATDEKLFPSQGFWLRRTGVLRLNGDAGECRRSSFSIGRTGRRR
jgi:two-component system, OmpR family, sensor histidine kinase TctE